MFFFPIFFQDCCTYQNKLLNLFGLFNSISCSFLPNLCEFCSQNVKYLPIFNRYLICGKRSQDLIWGIFECLHKVKWLRRQKRRDWPKCELWTISSSCAPKRVDNPLKPFEFSTFSYSISTCFFDELPRVGFSNTHAPYTAWQR